MSKRMVTVCLGLASVVLALCGLQMRFPLGWPPAKPDPVERIAPGVLEIGALRMEGMMVEGASGTGLLSLELRSAALPRPKPEPLALCVLLDTSGSMKGERKLGDALDAIGELLGRLLPGDRLALVTHANGAEVALELEARVDLGLARSTLASIRAGGATNISEALELGARVLDGAPGIRHLLLLSDGIPNRGVTSAQELIERTARLRERGISVSAIGLGINFNEDLLVGMANAGGGEYAYCRDGGTMAEALGREILRAHGVVAAEVTVEIELPPQVRTAHFYGRSLESGGRRLVYRLGELPAGERRDLLVRVTPAQGPITVHLRHRDLVHGKRAAAKLSEGRLGVEGPAGRLEQFPQAVAKVEIALSCTAVPRAIALAAAGKRLEALQIMDERISGLAARTPAVEPLFGTVLQALSDLRADLNTVEPGDAALRDIEIRSKLLTRDCR